MTDRQSPPVSATVELCLPEQLAQLVTQVQEETGHDWAALLQRGADHVEADPGSDLLLLRGEVRVEDVAQVVDRRPQALWSVRSWARRPLRESALDVLDQTVDRVVVVLHASDEGALRGAPFEQQGRDDGVLAGVVGFEEPHHVVEVAERRRRPPRSRQPAVRSRRHHLHLESPSRGVGNRARPHRCRPCAARPLLASRRDHGRRCFGEDRSAP